MLCFSLPDFLCFRKYNIVSKRTTVTRNKLEVTENSSCDVDEFETKKNKTKKPTTIKRKQ